MFVLSLIPPPTTSLHNSKTQAQQNLNILLLPIKATKKLQALGGPWARSPTRHAHFYSSLSFSLPKGTEQMRKQAVVPACWDVPIPVHSLVSPCDRRRVCECTSDGKVEQHSQGFLVAALPLGAQALAGAHWCKPSAEPITQLLLSTNSGEQSHIFSHSSSQTF